jgi:hypothetical protein
MAQVTDARAARHVFPQFVDGTDDTGDARFRSTLVIQTLANVDNRCELILETNVVLTFQDGSITNNSPLHVIDLPPNLFAIVKTQGTEPLASGYAVLSCSGEVTALLSYDLAFWIDGELFTIAEATVFSSPPGTRLQLINDSRGGARLGIAIANDSSNDTVVTVSVFDVEGLQVGSALVEIPTGSSTAQFLDEIVPSLPANHIGQIFFDSVQRIHLIGLKFTGVAFTTIMSTVRVQ